MSVSFYDRATNQPIEPLTDPKYCIEPVAQLTMYKQGKKFAAITELPTKRVIHKYKRTLRQRLLRKPNSTFPRKEFDFEKAVNHIVNVNDLQPNKIKEQ